MLLPVAGAHEAYAEELRERLAAAGVRAEVDDREEKLGYRMREAQLGKIPYVAVVGDKEIGSGSLQARAYGDDAQRSYEVGAFIEMLEKRIADRSL